VIAVKAFGINHAEMHMRRGEWAEAAEVSGIECVGIVDSCPTGEFAVGATVAALMGARTEIQAPDLAARIAETKQIDAVLDLTERHRRTSEERPARRRSGPRLSFDDIQEAHRVMEAGEAGGKMVVALD
jgi:hypothetical protein